MHTLNIDPWFLTHVREMVDEDPEPARGAGREPGHD